MSLQGNSIDLARFYISFNGWKEGEKGAMLAITRYSIFARRANKR